MKQEPKKVFILEDGKYSELSWREFSCRYELAVTYKQKHFLPLHGMLMEVNEDVYRDFYRDRRHQKYLRECSIKNGEIFYDMFTTDDFNGEDVLVDEVADTCEMAVNRIMLDRLRQVLILLTEEERRLVLEIFYEERSERELAKKYGISQAAIHKRKDRILEKLRGWIKI